MASTKASKAAKKKATKRVEVIEHGQDFIDFDAAEGASLITGDVSGYWDPEKSAIRCKPISCKMFDGEIESNKVSILIIAELTTKNILKSKDAEGEWEYNEVPAGTMAGIWYKPGMRGIVKKMGVDCYIKYVAEQDTGKPNPMKVYEVKAPAGGTLIPIIEDTREDSAEVVTDFHTKKPKKKNRPSSEEEPEEDDFEGEEEVVE